MKKSIMTRMEVWRDKVFGCDELMERGSTGKANVLLERECNKTEEEK